jgi:hypothetical protein
LIDTKGVKQPVFYTHQNFYKDSRKFIAESKARTGQEPSAEEFRQFAVKWFTTPAAPGASPLATAEK